MGLAEAVGLPTIIKRVVTRAPLGFLPGHMVPKPLCFLRDDSDILKPPWPQLLISCGRRSVPLSIAIRRASAGNCTTVHIQDPKVNPKNFDFVIPPKHDRLKGPNVIVTKGAINRITPDSLNIGAKHLKPHLAHIPRPMLLVLLGGDSNSYKLTQKCIRTLGKQLRTLTQTPKGAGLAITASRRTGAHNIITLKQELDRERTFFWDGTGENPYFGLLGIADAIAVTSDSVSMISEAATTGKPLYIIELEGGSRRLHSFHDMLRMEGITRPFTGQIEHWNYRPFNDTRKVACAIRDKLGLQD